MPKQTFGNRLKHAWDVFRNRDPTSRTIIQDIGYSSYIRSDKIQRRRVIEQSIVAAVYNRMAIDVAAVPIRHVRLDENGAYEEDIPSKLNYCLTTEANIDQTSQAFYQDIAMSLFDEGVIAVVPIETSLDPKISGSYDIHQLRTGKIVEWFPKHVTVNLYNENTGLREDITLPKSIVAIIENPLYAVMNEPNSTLQRLIRKLSLLDSIDEQSGSGKLDIIIQLPYVIKTEARRKQAEQRRKDIEMQLSGSKYGIAYTDGTERITQLNRAADNNLMKQIEYLTSMLFSQLGITEEVFNGTASEEVMLNYTARTIDPVVSAIVTEFKRKFLTRTARTQRQSIAYFKDPFRLITAGNLANAADKFTRNEIISSNEVRAVLGMKPSKDPAADELRNKNLNQPANADTDDLTPDQIIQILETLFKNPETIEKIDPRYGDLLTKILDEISDKI